MVMKKIKSIKKVQRGKVLLYGDFITVVAKIRFMSVSCGEPRRDLVSRAKAS